MTNAEAFKIGFRMQCTRDGLDADGTRERMEKAAAMLKFAGTLKDVLSMLTGAGEAIGSTALSIAKPLSSAGLTAAIVGPPLAGIGGGYLLSRLNNDVYDEEEAKTDEELAEMYRALDALERSRRLQPAK